MSNYTSNFSCSLGAHLGTRVHVHQGCLLHFHQTLAAASPLPEDVGAALELLLPLALNLEVVAEEGHFLQEHNQARTVGHTWHTTRRNQFRVLSGEVSYKRDGNEQQPSAWRGPGTQ